MQFQKCLAAKLRYQVTMVLGAVSLLACLGLI